MASLARKTLLRLSKSRWLAEHVMRRRFVLRAVKKFMPGEEVGDALDAAARLAPAGLGTLLTKLGENLTAESEAAEVRDHYLAVLDQIVARKLDAHVSVKPTQLGLDFSQRHCAEHLEILASKAEASGTVLWIDMEDSSYVDRTLDLYCGVRSRYPKVGLAMQAYLRRTPADLASLLPLQPIVRLVKGAYAEPAGVAFPDKRDVDQAYYHLAVELLRAAREGKALAVLGTHDMELVRRLVARAGELGATNGSYEIHMLYGIRMAEQKRLAAEGRVVKTLISYGNPGFPGTCADSPSGPPTSGSSPGACL